MFLFLLSSPTAVLVMFSAGYLLPACTHTRRGNEVKSLLQSWQLQSLIPKRAGKIRGLELWNSERYLDCEEGDGYISKGSSLSVMLVEIPREDYQVNGYSKKLEETHHRALIILVD